MADYGKWLGRLLGSPEGQFTGPALPHAHRQPGGPESFAEDNNDFALAMYGHLRQQPGNLFFSPFSVRTALGVAYAGARGETATQVSMALFFPPSDEKLHIALAEIIHRLNAAGGGKYEMAVANSLWGQDGAPLQAGFLDLVARHYAGGVHLVDFRRSAEAARVTINQWIEDNTRQKIGELIPSGALNADTRLVLVNAVYFKGMWVLQFRKADTHEEPFYFEDGGSVRAPLMQQQGEIRHLRAQGYQAVDLNYRGGDLSMLILLPDKKDGLRNLEMSLSRHMLDDCVAKLGVREVKVILPRFKFTWGTVNMGDQLTALGMPLAFDQSRADFSGINGHTPPDEQALFISAVFHKTFIEVNEEGTEAAAATAATARVITSMYSTPPRVPVFRADHPFLCAIRDRKTGAILFLGRISNPTQES
jgi:serpin B